MFLIWPIWLLFWLLAITLAFGFIFFFSNMIDKTVDDWIRTLIIGDRSANCATAMCTGKDACIDLLYCTNKCKHLSIMILLSSSCSRLPPPSQRHLHVDCLRLQTDIVTRKATYSRLFNPLCPAFFGILPLPNKSPFVGTFFS